MTPLLGFVLALFGGLTIALRTAALLPDGAAPATVLTSAPLGLGLLLWTAASIRGRRGRGTSALAGAAVLGFALGTAGASHAAEHCLATIPDAARVSVRGTMASLPSADAAVEVRVRELRTGAGWRECGGTVRMRLPRDGRQPEVGAPIQLTGRWFAFPPESSWPRPPGRAGYLAASSLRPVEGGVERLVRARGQAQARLRALIPERAAVAEALLLARRDGLDTGLKRDFAASGLTHLLAISGTHVGFVAAVLLMLATAARLPPGPAGAAATAGATAYVLFLGAPHAAARAALQLIALAFVRALQRPADPFTLLAAAGLLITMADPLAPLDAGFQLSFAGIFGLVAWQRPLGARLPAAWPRWLRDSLAAGTAATLATSPIAALHFGTVAPIAIAANLIAVPLCGLAVPALALALLADAASTSLAEFLGHGASVLLGGLRLTAASAAAIPGGHAAIARHEVMALLGAAAAAVFAVRALRAGEDRRRARTSSDAGARRQRVRLRRIAAAAAATAVLAAWPVLARRTGDGSLEIHAIDVGQGDALAVRTPAGRWILIDTGPRSDRFDAGRARVVPFLLDNGARTLDVLVLTHPDADHIGGAEAVFEALDVRTVVDPGIAAGKEMYLGTLAAGRVEGARWLAGREGRVLRIDDVELEFLAPTEASLDAPGEANDFSVVFRLGFGSFGALFLGDAPEAVEEEIIAARGRSLAAAVLKVGHHGSTTSTGDSLLTAVAPRVALVSVGLRNRYGHPATEVMARLSRHGVRVLRTDRQGTLTVRAGADGDYELRTAR
jgi:competence protein ComEC